MATKKINELSLRTDFDATCNLPADDATQTWRVTGQQIRNLIAPLTTLGDLLYAAASGVATRLAGNITTTRYFLTQTGNGTVSAAPVWSEIKSPTLQKFTSGSGTYTTPAGVKWIRLIMSGGGGGGSGSGTGGGGSVGSTGNSSFWKIAGGAAIHTCVGGNGGNLGSGGNGGSATIGSGGVGQSYTGGKGGGLPSAVGTAIGMLGGGGGQNPLGGAHPGASGASAGVAGAANTGAGGSGAGSTESATAGVGGDGGGAGGYLNIVIAAPSATYDYVVGGTAAGGAAGSGTGAAAGGAGAAGVIIVEEFYQ